MQSTVSRRRACVSLSWVFVALAVLAAPPQSHEAAAPEAAVAQAAARQSPDWLRDGVIYEIFPRAFSPQGNFDGVTAQLDRLKDLGVNIVWLMPIHPVGKEKSKGTLGSPYAVRDYDAVSPEYGNAEDLKRLVAAAHQRGMKVFIDIVANHTSWDSVLMARHPDWYRHDAAGHIVPPNPDWVDVAQLDYSKPALREYMSGMLVRWLRDFQLDGFRCDFASGVPTDFWNSVRAPLDRAQPDLAMLAEADDPALLRSAFDIDYGWEFYHAVSEALTGAAPASAVRAVGERDAARDPRGALRLRFSAKHDQLRTTGAAGLPAALAASALMFTLDGVPLLYNGMEVGDNTESAAPALFERVPIAWQMAERRPSVTAYYKSLAQLRRAHPAFTRGALRWLGNDDERRILSFERSGAGESLIVVINLSSQPWQGRVQAGAGDYRDVTPEAKASAARKSVLPQVSLAAWEFRVFSRVKP